jgi:23S rRNA (cytidine2498-2'-O)-methyltransferase
VTGAAYLAADGYERQLREELGQANVRVTAEHGRLFRTNKPPVSAAWAANTWIDPVEIPITSIGHAASQLKAIQRNWVAYAPEHTGRARLIVEKLPYVSAKPIEFDRPMARAPLGSFTLLTPDLLLASAACTSPFPNGEALFVEDREGPPSRAYLKLWEALVRSDARPGPGDTVLDLGASPGGWTWLLAQTGAKVIAVDKAPLAANVASMRNVTWREGSAFALEPADVPGVTWLFSDIICYPDRLLRLVQKWRAAGVANMVCTIKLQGETDYAAIDAFKAEPGAEVFHSSQNKHELSFALTVAGVTREEHSFGRIS